LSAGGTVVTHVGALTVGTAANSGYGFGQLQTLVCGSACSNMDGHIDAVGTPSVMQATTITVRTVGSRERQGPAP
jgi:hypothetical protein